MKSLTQKKKILIGIAAVLIILLIIGSVLYFNKIKGKTGENKAKETTTNYVAYVKINPSIKLEYTQTCKQTGDKLDCEEPKVTKYELVNEDAKNIYKDINLLDNNKNLFEVLDLICTTAKNNGIEFEKVDIYTDWNKIEN